MVTKMANRELCVECNGTMREVIGVAPTIVNQERMSVAGARFLECRKCGSVQYTPDQMDAIDTAAHRIYRNRYHLLSPVDVVSIRKRSGLSQRAMAELLGLGPNTISRWETDRNVQTAALDRFLRVLDADGADHIREVLAA